MARVERPPAGPRGVVGAAAEEAVARHLEGLGWTVIARNIRVGDDEVDIVAREPGANGATVIVEVRSRSGPGFGAAVESVDARKVGRLYRAAWGLHRDGHPAVRLSGRSGAEWRVDLLTARRRPDGGWEVDRHVRGLAPP